MSATGVLEHHTTLTLPKVGTLVVVAHDRDSVRLGTDMERGSHVGRGYDQFITIHRVQYVVDLQMRDITTVPEDDRHRWTVVVDPWAHQRATTQPLRFYEWRRNDYPSQPARKFFTENVVVPFAEWLSTPEAAGVLAGGAQLERDNLRRSGLGSVQTLSSKLAELRLLLQKLERCEDLSDDEKTVLSSTRLEYR